MTIPKGYNRAVRGAIIVGILFGPPLLAVTPVLRGDTIVERADAWVASRVGRLPMELNGFAALPLPYRKAIY
jgi:hypothetical protein